MHRFRVARPASVGWNVFKTLVQLVLIWTGSLAVVPALIVYGETFLGIGQIHFPGQFPVAVTLFGLFSLLGLGSAAAMSVRGRGTPLPYDSARELVLIGPYAYIRNPMAVAGLGQGFAVALGTGSITVLAYVFLGMLIWQFLIRPSEEADLEARFGRPYLDYRAAVPCWRPALRRYPR